jgi:hypothetical protein
VRGAGLREGFCGARADAGACAANEDRFSGQRQGGARWEYGWVAGCVPLFGRGGKGRHDDGSFWDCDLEGELGEMF